MRISRDLGEEGVRFVTLGSNSARLEISFSRAEMAPELEAPTQP